MMMNDDNTNLFCGFGMNIWQTLADFQYIDSSGSDQGQNVRRKSQSLVSLVNNKERIQEVRQKAAANREK
jgi:epsin